MARWNARAATTALFTTVAAGALASCGGGGGSVQSVPPVSNAPSPTPPPAPAPAPTPSPTPTPTPAPRAATSTSSCTSGCASSSPPQGFVITPANVQAQRSARDDAEFRRNYTVAEYVGALFALDNGWTGQGVRVGVMDDGVHAVADLGGKVDTGLSRDFGYVETNGVRSARSAASPAGDASSTHGTSVAAIIAARDDGQGVQGLAPGATIVSLRVDAEVDGAKVWGVNRNLALRHAADARIPLVNMSLSLTPGSTGSSAFRDALAHYNRTAKGLLIVSTGNGGQDTSPTAVEVDPAFAESWLFVAALRADGRDYELASYSSRCGTVMDRCVVAPTNSTTMGAGGEIVVFGGTSAAAPVATSVAAMILSKWPQLTGVDAGNIILASARDLGAPGTDPVYGRGMVDAEAALRPVNPVLASASASAPLPGNVMVVGEAFGGMTGDSFGAALGDVTVLDHYGRDYQGDLSALVIRPDRAAGGAMYRRVEAQMNAQHAAFGSPAREAAIGVAGFDTGLRDTDGLPVLRRNLAFADVTLRLSDRLALTGGFNSGGSTAADILGLAPPSDAMQAFAPLAQIGFGIARKLGPGTLALAVHHGGESAGKVRGTTLEWRRGPASVKLGLVDERGSVFGTPVGAGMLRFGDGARTAFIEGAGGFDLGSWRFEGFGSLGRTRLRLGPDMLLSEAGAITTGRFGIIASRPALAGRVSFGLAQPLVVVDGSATFTVAGRYDLASRSLRFEDRRVDLAGTLLPQLTIGYERAGPRSDLRIGAASDAAARDLRALATWSLRWPASR